MKTNGLNVLDRIERGYEARHFIEQAVSDEYVATISFFSPQGFMAPSKEKRIRREALAEFAYEEGVAISEVKADIQVIEAIDRVRECDEGVAEAIRDETIGLTTKELLCLGRMNRPSLEKAVLELRKALRDCAEY